jgi:hypothetical protein
MILLDVLLPTLATTTKHVRQSEQGQAFDTAEMFFKINKKDIPSEACNEIILQKAAF